MKILSKLEKRLDFWFLLIISVIFFLLRFPSLFEPNWYGDEGIYQTLGLGINTGRLLYRDIFDNKPPLLYLLYSFVNSDQFLIRLLSLISGILAVIVFFILAKKIFKNKKATIISTCVFAILFGLPLIEGNIANAENFMLLPNLLAGFLIIKSLDLTSAGKKYSMQILAGLVLGISFLIKIVAIFDFAAFLVFLAFANYSGILKELINPKILFSEIKKIIPFVVSFLVPIVLTTLFFMVNHAFSNFISAVFFSNIGYVGYGNKFIIPQGLLILKLAALSIFALFIFFKRKVFGGEFSFVSIWLAFSLFNAYFSQRPYTHYVLVLLPAFCLILGFTFVKKNYAVLAGIFTVVSLFVVLLGFTFYVKTIFYYQNFASFIIGAKSVTDYQRFFDGNTPNDYEIASFINLYVKSKDNVFIWGNNAQVYDLTNKLPPGKYTVAYHITNYKDGPSNTQNGLQVAKPKFIVIMPNVSTYQFSLINYYPRVNINGIEIYEKLYQ